MSVLVPTDYTSVYVGTFCSAQSTASLPHKTPVSVKVSDDNCRALDILVLMF
jgi:hypothetical protein